MIPGIDEKRLVNGVLVNGWPSYATMHQATATFQEMGERTIATQVRIDGSVVPSFDGWELSYKGERFVLPTKLPQGSKDNSTRNALVDLNFQSWVILQMKRYFFFQTPAAAAGMAVPDQYIASVNMDIVSFKNLFNDVLKYYFGENVIVMDLFSQEYSTDLVLVEINYSHIWEVLTKFYDTFGYRWTLAYEDGVYKIKVNYPASAIEDHDFEYGYEGGLLKFERQVQDETIKNILLGRGGENNLPYRYFKLGVTEQGTTWTGDPDAIPELKDIYFDRLRDINFRWYVRGWMHNPNRDTSGDEAWDPNHVFPTYTISQDSPYYWAYQKGLTDTKFQPVEYVKDDQSIAQNGEHWGALENNDDIYPTIQRISRDPIGRVDETVAVSEIITDDIEAAAKSAIEENILNGRKNVTVTIAGTSSSAAPHTHTEAFIGEPFTVPAGKTANLYFTVGEDGLQYFKSFSNQVFATEAYKENIIIDTSGSSLMVKSELTGEIIPASAVPAGTYRYVATVKINNENDDGFAQVTYGFNGIRIAIQDEDSNAWKPTFDIWVKNIWDTTKGSGETDQQYAERVWKPILGDKLGNEAKLVFSTGPMSISQDYEFQIATYPTYDTSKIINDVPSHWRITLRKSEAEFEATGLFIPNTTTGGKPLAGDKFFFIGIDMPHQYVEWAEEELNTYKSSELDEVKDVNPTYAITLDKVRTHTMEPEDEEYGQVLADRLYAGCTIQTTDPRFTPNEVLTLYVQTLTLTWNEGENTPNIEVILADKVVSVQSPISILGGEVSSIRSNYVRTSDLESAIRRVATPLFLKKTGEADSSNSPTTFASKVASKAFRQGDIGGAGWGFYEDGDGNTTLELDTIVARKEMRVNTLVANQIKYIGGKEIKSAASMECTQVIDTDDGYMCYFDQKQGTAKNLFLVGDFAYIQEFDTDMAESRYCRRRVNEVGTDYILLSKSVVDGSGVPKKGDTIVQYGSDTVPSRQYVIITDVIGGGYERMLSGLSSVNSAGDEYYFAGRQSGSGPRWFVGSHNGEYAYWENGQLNIKGRIQVIGESGGYHDLGYLADAFPKLGSTLIQGGLVLTSLIQLGQTETEQDVDVFKVYSGINGDLDDTLVDPTTSIAAWYGGEMLEKSAWEQMSTEDQALHRYAKTVFRHNGSGYLASGSIYWEPTGAGGIPGITWSGNNIVIAGNVKLGSLSGDAVTDVLSLLQKINNWFEEDSNGDLHLKNKLVNGQSVGRGFWTSGFIAAGGLGSSGGGGGGGADLLSVWTSLQNNNEDEHSYDAWKIHTAHLPTLNVSDGLSASYSTPSGSGVNMSTQLNIGLTGIAWSKITSGKPTTIAGYGITDAYTKTQVDNLIGAIEQFHYEIYPTLADITTPASNVLYLIGPTGSGSDKYEEYVYANSTFTKIGDTSIDLTGYINTVSRTPASGGNYISGYTKSGSTLTFSFGTLPTARTITGAEDMFFKDANDEGEDVTIEDSGETGTVLWGAESANQVALSVNGVSKTLVKMQALDGIRSSITTILGYFSGGSAYNALALEGHNSAYFATASALSALSSVVDTKLSVAVTSLGGATGAITLGSGLSMSGNQLSVLGQTFGTVTSVGLSMPTGFSVASSPVTSSGTIAVTFASGYSLPSTASQNAWSAKYDKPSGGIPATDLASAVQTSLGLADSALQSHQTITLAGGTNNGTLKLTTAAGTTDNIAVTGLGAAAYRGVASTIGSSITNLVPGSLLYGVLGDAYDSTNTVKAFVNSSIATATATFRGTDSTSTTESDFLAWANALTHDLNDYVFWATSDSAGNTVYKRYKYDGTNWVFEYDLNNSSFTSSQWAAINSGITTALVTAFGNKYDKPIGGIPNTDLANSAITIAGTGVSLGGSISASTLRSNLSISNVENTKLSTWAGTQNITTLGTITTGVWSGTAIAANKLAIDLNWTLIGDSATYDTDDYIHVS